jgi:predicted Zn-dependent protease
MMMQSWIASYQGREATVLASQKFWSVGYLLSDEQVHTEQWQTDNLKVEYRLADDSSIVTNLVSGQHLSIEGSQAAKWYNDWQAERNKPWYRRSENRLMARMLAISFSFLLIIFLSYLFLAPWVSEKMAMQFSPDTEAALGHQLFNAASKGINADTAAERHLQAFADRLSFQSPYQIRLTLAIDDEVNAYAFPGGHIVVNSGLLKKLETYPELAALLAHEFIHVRERHTLRQLFRYWGRSLFITLVMGDMAGITRFAIERADQLQSLQYSRKSETDADLLGQQLLQEANIDDEGFIRLMLHLQKADRSVKIPEYLSSHPHTDRRLEELKKNLSTVPAQTDDQLEYHFQQLKNIYP